MADLTTLITGANLAAEQQAQSAREAADALAGIRGRIDAESIDARRAIDDHTAAAQRQNRELNAHTSSIETVGRVKANQLEAAKRMDEASSQIEAVEAWKNKPTEGPLDVLKALFVAPVMERRLQRAVQQFNMAKSENAAFTQIIQEAGQAVTFNPPTDLLDAEANLRNVKENQQVTKLQVETLKDQISGEQTAAQAQVNASVTKVDLELRRRNEQRAQADQKAQQEYAQAQRKLMDAQLKRIEEDTLARDEYKQTLKARGFTEAQASMLMEDKNFIAYDIAMSRNIWTPEDNAKNVGNPSARVAVGARFNNSYLEPLAFDLIQAQTDAEANVKTLGLVDPTTNQPIELNYSRMFDASYVGKTTDGKLVPVFQVRNREGQIQSVPDRMADMYTQFIYNPGSPTIKAMVNGSEQLQHLVAKPVWKKYQQLQNITDRPLTSEDYLAMIDGKEVNVKDVYDLMLSLGNVMHNSMPWTALGYPPTITGPRIPITDYVLETNRWKNTQQYKPTASTMGSLEEFELIAQKRALGTQARALELPPPVFFPVGPQ